MLLEQRMVVHLLLAEEIMSEPFRTALADLMACVGQPNPTNPLDYRVMRGKGLEFAKAAHRAQTLLNSIRALEKLVQISEEAGLYD